MITTTVVPIDDKMPKRLYITTMCRNANKIPSKMTPSLRWKVKTKQKLLWIAVGFGLFRLFDILKPWPIRLADKRVHGGLGIMLDDVLAGIFALAVLQLLIRFFTA